ncbi:MAG: hypothetical protein IJ553_00840 [Alloprevotella sp.]|nr:hypothetical protein [Alloprevotella sp.]
MKSVKHLLKVSFILVCVVLLCGSHRSNPIRPDGTYKGQKLMGRVHISGGGATFRVYVASKRDADLHVKFLPSRTARRVGEWEIVPYGRRDFSVEFVNSRARADFTIYIVDDNPGVNQ